MFQPDLFGELSSERRPRRAQFFSLPGRFLRLRLAYEDLLFGVLALMLVLLGGFCLGVERGKRLAGPPPLLLTSEGLAAAGESNALPAAADPRLADGKRQKRPVPVIPVGMTSVPAAQSLASSEGQAGVPGPYVIQLASYSTERVAREEVRRLEKRGVRVELVKQGRYFELRAVGFRSREEAVGTLNTLRQTYRDAFLKRVGPG